MAIITKKQVDARHQSIFELKGDAAETSLNVRINPELLYGAKVILNIDTGDEYTVGEVVTQTSGAKGRVVRHDSGVGKIVISTERDTDAVFNTTDDLVGETSGTTKNVVSKETVDYLLNYVRSVWVNQCGSDQWVALLWEATSDEKIIQIPNGRGDWWIPGTVVKPQTIAGQTGSIGTLTSGTYAGHYTILLEIHKDNSNNSFIYQKD